MMQSLDTLAPEAAARHPKRWKHGDERTYAKCAWCGADLVNPVYKSSFSTSKLEELPSCDDCKSAPFLSAQINGHASMETRDFKTARDWLKLAMPKRPRTAAKRSKGKAPAKVDPVPTAADVKRARQKRDRDKAASDRELAEMVKRAHSAKVPMRELADAMSMSRQALYLFLERVK